MQTTNSNLSMKNVSFKGFSQNNRTKKALESLAYYIKNNNEISKADEDIFVKNFDTIDKAKQTVGFKWRCTSSHPYEEYQPSFWVDTQEKSQTWQNLFGELFYSENVHNKWLSSNEVDLVDADKYCLGEVMFNMIKNIPDRLLSTLSQK